MPQLTTRNERIILLRQENDPNKKRGLLLLISDTVNIDVTRVLVPSLLFFCFIQ